MRPDNRLPHNEDDNRRNKMIAAIVTLVATVCVILILLLAKISYQEITEPPMPDSEILFGGEYVMLGNYAETVSQSTPAATPAQETSEESYDMTDAGSSDASSEVISMEEESEMQVTPREEKSGPTKEELEQIEKEKRRKELQSKINKRVNFSNTGKSEGSAGAPDGKSDGSEITGSASFSLKGRTAEYFGTPSSGVDGKVIVEVRVNPKGQVTSAKCVGGVGSAAANNAVRRSCEQASLKSKFNVAREVTTDQLGTITWTFE